MYNCIFFTYIYIPINLYISVYTPFVVKGLRAAVAWKSIPSSDRKLAEFTRIFVRNIAARSRWKSQSQGQLDLIFEACLRSEQRRDYRTLWRNLLSASDADYVPIKSIEQPTRKRGRSTDPRGSGSSLIIAGVQIQAYRVDGDSISRIVIRFGRSRRARLVFKRFRNDSIDARARAIHRYRSRPRRKRNRPSERTMEASFVEYLSNPVKYPREILAGTRTIRVYKRPFGIRSGFRRINPDPVPIIRFGYFLDDDRDGLTYEPVFSNLSSAT